MKLFSLNPYPKPPLLSTQSTNHQPSGKAAMVPLLPTRSSHVHCLASSQAFMCQTRSSLSLPQQHARHVSNLSTGKVIGTSPFIAAKPHITHPACTHVCHPMRAQPPSMYTATQCCIAGIAFPLYKHKHPVHVVYYLTPVCA